MRFHEALQQILQGSGRRLYWTEDGETRLPAELGNFRAYDGCPYLEHLMEDVCSGKLGHALSEAALSSDPAEYRKCAEKAKGELAAKFGAQLADYAVDSISFALRIGFSLSSYNDLNRRLADMIATGSWMDRGEAGTGGSGASSGQYGSSGSGQHGYGEQSGECGSGASSGQYGSSGSGQHGDTEQSGECGSGASSGQYGSSGSGQHGDTEQSGECGSGASSGQYGSSGSGQHGDTEQSGECSSGSPSWEYRRPQRRPWRDYTAGERLLGGIIGLLLLPVRIFIHGALSLPLLLLAVMAGFMLLSAIQHLSGNGERLPSWAADPIIAVIGGGFGAWQHFAGDDESWGLADDMAGTIGAMHAEQASPEEYETALGWFRRGASWGGARSAYLAGVMSYYGLGTAKDYREALRLFMLSAGQGVPAAENAVGVMHYFGRGVPQNYAEAFRWFRKAAERGMPAAENNLASMYLAGQGTAKSPGDAEKWFREAGKSLPESGIDGVMFDIERPEKGGSQSADSELQRWREAAEQGDAAAEYYLGTLSESWKNIEEAISWYERSAEQGYRPAVYRIRYFRDTVRRSAAEDEAGAAARPQAEEESPAPAPAADDAVPMDAGARRIADAARGGDAAAQYRLGKMFSDGNGVPEDHAKAAEWLRKAAAQGSTDAYSHLCLMYHEGFLRGGTASAEEEWLRKGAEHGSSGCMSYLGDMLLQGRGDHADPGEALSWYLKAAGLGNVRAAYTLGVMYREGNWVRQDYAESAKWFRKGAEQGDPLSERSLGLACRKGLGVPRNEAEAEKWLGRAERHMSEMTGGLRIVTPDGE